ncbi:beta-1,3-galactosyltransferase 1-like isoform X2 [Ornithodoros turicata]|uniref:beta-1,3-galactosyltransferase 1-like isoform X2 n=1 Tax=Ornithodoros turicata TaxID=34597 RepID=UPI0031389BA5
MPSAAAKRSHIRMKPQEDMATGLVRILPRLAAVAICLLFIYGLLYRPLSLSTMNGHPRPDMSWVLSQQDLRLLVSNGSLTLSPRGRCPTLLTIIVCSAVRNAAARLAIRNSWARDAHAPYVRVFFLLGHMVNDTLQDKVEEESRLFGDIIQEGFIDTYNNLTVKSVVLLKWANEHCPQSRFVLKTDDDMFINVPNLITLLRTVGRKKLLLGCLISRATPVRDWSSKWYVPSFVYADHTYPDYLSGTGYVMSREVVKSLLQTALATPFFYLEDIFVTGIVAQKAAVKPMNHDGFKYYKRKNNVCIFRKLITGHNMSPKELQSMWAKVRGRGVMCS